MVATDLTRRSELVIDTAIRFGHAFDASLELIHIADSLRVLFRGGDVQSGSQAGGAGRRRRDARIDRVLAAQCMRARTAGLSCITTALEGQPVRQILSHLRKVKADLLVAGIGPEVHLGYLARGRTGFGLARGVDLPVLLVPLGPSRDRRR